MLETRTLEMFVVLAGELHFGRTADRLGLSQSVVSTGIRRLEDRLGADLFVRGRRSAVKLTSVGATFLVEATRALRQLAQAERIGRSAGRGEAGTYSVGYVFSAAASGVLSAGLSAVRRSLPMIALTAEPMETPEQILAVEDGRLDLGFVRPRAAYPDGVAAHVVHREGLLLAIPTEHRLAQTAAIQSWMLAGETFLVPQFGETAGFALTLRRLATRGGFTTPAIRPTSDFVTAISLAAANLGVSLVPRAIANIHVAGVCYREIVDHHDVAELALVWRRDGAGRLADAIIADCVADPPAPGGTDDPL